MGEAIGAKPKPDAAAGIGPLVKGIETVTRYTKAEKEAINAAWQEVRHLCRCTNWSDGPEWRDAERLERQQCASDEQDKAAKARAMICKGWLEGLENPDAPARSLYWIRRGYRDALFLGVRHAIERRGDEYTGPMVERAAALCREAVAANEAHTRRIVKG